MLPSYIFDDIHESSDKNSEWAEAIKIAALSTTSYRAAKRMKVYVDKKSFKSQARRQILELLEEERISYTMNKKEITR